MSGTEFVKLIEKNDHEGETWVFWLQYTGNEEELEKLDKLLKDWAENAAYDLDFELDTGLIVGEQTVDILVEHQYDRGRYNPAHNKLSGTFTCPEDPGLDDIAEEWGDPNVSRERLFYKGQIARYFSA